MMAAQGAAANAQAGAGTSPPPPAKGSMLWLQGLICGALLAFATPTAMLLATLMAPAIACLVAETGPTRGIPRAVGLCCGAASLAPVWHLWAGDNSVTGAFTLLSDPLTVVLAWGSGLCAWAMCQVLPVLVRTAWDAKEAARAKAIERQLEAYREEWDFPKE